MMDVTSKRAPTAPKRGLPQITSPRVTRPKATSSSLFQPCYGPPAGSPSYEPREQTPASRCPQLFRLDSLIGQKLIGQKLIGQKPWASRLPRMAYFGQL